MAATPFNPSDPGSSFVFDIYNDGQALRPAPVLPGGPCNYTDQTLPRCGCRRFWSRLSLGGGLQDNNLAEICMCSHHACFHEDVQSGGQLPPAAATNAVNQENQKPRTNREPLSPVQGLESFHIPSGLGMSMNFDLTDFQSMASHQVDVAIALQAEDVRSGPESTLPDTLNSWGNLLQSQPGDHDGPDGLPPIPSQCLMPPTHAPSVISVASSSQARYLRPFAGKGLHTLSGDRPPLGEAVDAETVPGSAPDNSTASRTAELEHRDFAASFVHSQDRASGGVSGEAWQKLSNTVGSHEQRLDKLENPSFSVASHEDCHEKHEHADARVTELESRVEEVEKILNDNGSIAGSRRTVRQDGSPDATASVASVATDATVLGPNRVEMYSQLQSLQAQVSQLQAASLPSYTKPWELEVVFLPFPLKGVWMEARDFPSQRRSTGTNGDEWTQMPNTISRATPDPSSPKFQEWAGQSADSNWLLPRAFAAGRVIDQRLKSRGLIKTVLVRGPDARSIHLAIYNAFGDVFRISANAGASSGYDSSSPLAEFLGLRQPWVPLRKLHKDSRLRFLSPAEMATPTLWDFTFLVSSVVMKATGTHRLYITQPEAYLQDHPLGYHAFEPGWSWQKLRELSRVFPDSQSSVSELAFPEADALEECWAWNDRLDEPPSATSSTLSLRQHQRRMSRGLSVTPSQQFFTGNQSPILSTSPIFPAGQPLHLQRERHGSRPPHVRTHSLPPAAGAMPSPSQSRLRSAHTSAASPYERRSSPFLLRASPRPPGYHSVATPAMSAAANPIFKRRLGTRSPSLAPRNTPRWSRTSMSRSPSLAPGGPLVFHDDRERRTTPFFYATPHSDALPDYIYQQAGNRPQVAVRPSDGYDPDDEEMEDDFGDDQGSSTDPYDSEMTNDVNNSAKKLSRHSGSFGLGHGSDDGGLDIDIYDENDEDELDGVDTDGGYDPAAWNGFGQGQGQGPPQDSQEGPRPEDEPWPGIEDAMSDGENVDPSQSQSQSQSQIMIHEDEDVDILDRDDDGSEASQAPSEYSSKQNAWNQPVPVPLSSSRGHGHDRESQASQGFHIHEDRSGPETQWA
ncbi:hypothetical protein B0T14DRAFT_430819 [Immersiella caudata]|uniref:Uncharacterized protein n=1 Tax=Immersiella caudata TaxID=314043 RepID=A0AA39WPT7_9PEZI|nr:hypothetical protein B0T14DRAFT_430819 [Immersiella caudata]